jgi:hypothetical protein
MIDLPAFEAECQRDIPLLNAMHLALINYDDLVLTMEAPLAPNINNKGTAVGGSIASICLFGGCLGKLRSGSDERIRFDVGVELFHDERRCATMHGVYVVWLT